VVAMRCLTVDTCGRGFARDLDKHKSDTGVAVGINEIIVWILMICMVLGAIDRIIGNKFGLGKEFEEGFNAMGPLALAMLGIMCLAPILGKLLTPVVTASLPTAQNVFMYASRYGAVKDLARDAVLLTTAGFVPVVLLAAALLH